MKPLLLSVLLLTGAGCFTPAPPPDTTVQVQAILEDQRADLETARENRDGAYAVWAAKYREKVVTAIQSQFEKDVAAAADADAMIGLVKERDEAIAALDKVIAETNAKLMSDDTIDAALEANAVGLDYVSEISERDVKLAKTRALLKLGAKK